jgi:hypothetical protein
LQRIKELEEDNRVRWTQTEQLIRGFKQRDGKQQCRRSTILSTFLFVFVLFVSFYVYNAAQRLLLAEFFKKACSANPNSECVEIVSQFARLDVLTAFNTIFAANND